MKKYAKTYTITSAQMDPDFRLSATGIAQLFQDCFASYMAMYECAAFDLRKLGKMWIISDFSFQADAPLPVWGEKITVTLWLSHEPALKVRCDWTFTHRGREFVRGNSSWAILDIENRQPVLARTILTKQEICEEYALEQKRHVMTLPDTGTEKYFHKANNCDTDFNGHVSNLTYLRICLESMPLAYHRTHAISCMSMRFLHESFLDDNLEAQFARDGERWTFIIGDGKGSTVSQASMEFTDTSGQDRDFWKDSEIRKTDI